MAEQHQFSKTWDNPPPEKLRLKQQIQRRLASKIKGLELEGQVAKRYFDLVEGVFFEFPAKPEIGALRGGEIDILLQNCFLELTISPPTKKIMQLRKYLYEHVNPDQLPVILFSAWAGRLTKNKLKALSNVDATLIMAGEGAKMFEELDKLIAELHPDD